MRLSLFELPKPYEARRLAIGAHRTQLNIHINTERKREIKLLNIYISYNMVMYYMCIYLHHGRLLADIGSNQPDSVSYPCGDNPRFS